MDYRLLQRRNRQDYYKGTECWLVALWEPDAVIGDSGVVPALGLTNYYEDITNAAIHAGVVHTHYNLSVEEPPSMDGEGLPTGVLVISNVTLALQDDMVANGYFRRGKCTIIPYNTAVPDADYSGDMKQLEIISHEINLQQIKLQLAVPKELIEMVPEDLWGVQCRHRFKSDRCGYTGVLTTCGKNLKDCDVRGRQASYGGTPGLRPMTMKVGA